MLVPASASSIHLTGLEGPPWRKLELPLVNARGTIQNLGELRSLVNLDGQAELLLIGAALHTGF